MCIRDSFRVERREQAGRLLFAGRLCARKGVKELLQAVATLRGRAEPRLVLAGSLADRAYVADLRQRAGSLGIADQVDFRGSLTGDELLRELAECSVLV